MKLREQRSLMHSLIYATIISLFFFPYIHSSLEPPATKRPRPLAHPSPSPSLDLDPTPTSVMEAQEQPAQTSEEVGGVAPPMDTQVTESQVSRNSDGRRNTVSTQTLCLRVILNLCACIFPLSWIKVASFPASPAPECEHCKLCRQGEPAIFSHVRCVKSREGIERP